MKVRSSVTFNEFNGDLGFDLGPFLQGHFKVNLIFLNGTLYILLHIFIAYLESFPKHYNKTYFH